MVEFALKPTFEISATFAVPVKVIVAVPGSVPPGTGLKNNCVVGVVAPNVYFGVLKYTFNGSTPTAQLFLSPDPTAAEPGTADVTVTGIGSTVANISDVGFRAQSSGVVGNFVFDNVMVGTTWADVTTVPEPTTFALAGLGMLGLVLARRMRR